MGKATTPSGSMSAAATETKPKRSASASRSASWADLAKAGASRICELLYESLERSDHSRDSAAAEAMSSAEQVLYVLQTSELSDSFWRTDDPSAVASLVRSARDHLTHATSLPGADDLQRAVLPTAIALLAELEAALLPLPGDMRRLQAFASFKVPDAGQHSAALAVPPTAQAQLIALLLEKAEHDLRGIIRTRCEDDDWDEGDIDVDNATELALAQILRMRASPPLNRDAFLEDWYLIGSTINLAAKAFSRTDCLYQRHLDDARKFFELMPEVVEFAEPEGAHG